MNCRRETKVIYNHKVIYTCYFGDVSYNFILSALMEWLTILRDQKSIEYLVFDYTDANMNLLSTNDVCKIALSSQLLVKTKPSLKMIGVMPNLSDFTITSVWAGFAVRDKSVINFENIIIVDSFKEAESIILERIKIAHSTEINSKNPQLIL